MNMVVSKYADEVLFEMGIDIQVMDSNAVKRKEIENYQLKYLNIHIDYLLSYVDAVVVVVVVASHIC